ncbi:zinc ribbon domain-containing protein [Photobacterium halotolerans]|uniref:zinc ribbon domain-containing protein n=1 Tax=Photobacterium halotolerans TaxID=265726 RepID=UPI00040B7D92|nr:zinc ribbon domain-containing protein [Photobacterium halotolerans]
MSQPLCPACRLNLVWQYQGYFCPHCERRAIKHATCHDCGHPLERLNACGAANYFCPHCNELKSKSQALITFTLADKTTE